MARHRNPLRLPPPFRPPYPDRPQRRAKSFSTPSRISFAGFAAAVVLIAVVVMSLLPTSHAAFVSPKAAGRERRRRAGPPIGGFGCPPGAGSASMPFLMASVVCKDGEVTVTRTYQPSGGQKKEGKDGSGGGDDEEGGADSAKEGGGEVTENFSIFTRIFRPMSLSSQKAAPVLVLHGGPSVPSDYLYPLVDVVPYRSMVYFDQVGCGKSSVPKDVNAYSISKSVDDLEAVIKKLGLRRFHIYGQSFGGILAFEYLKRVAERNDPKLEGEEGCLSLILSSTPTSVKIVEAAAERLLDALRDEDDDESTLGERFRARHQCRTPSMPAPLLDAYAHAGTVWRGTHAIPDYAAEPPADGAARMPSTMVVRGEFDFVDHECVEGWLSGGGLFNHKFVREKVMDGCAHHGLLENGRVYGEMVDSFFSEYD